MSDHQQVPAARRFGVVAAVATTALTALTFALALTALPDRAPYPFATPAIAAQWPGDYLWMVPAMLLMLAFVALTAAVHEHAAPHRRVYSLLGLCVAVMAATVQLANYFLQFSVMQLNLEKNQLDGWALLTQYNPNGVFIALEELAYLLMSLALLALTPVFRGRGRAERALRWLLPLSTVAVLVALAAVSAVRGLDRGDSFEIAVITIVWLTLIAAGPLMAAVFRREA